MLFWKLIMLYQELQNKHPVIIPVLAQTNMWALTHSLELYWRWVKVSVFVKLAYLKEIVYKNQDSDEISEQRKIQN